MIDDKSNKWNESYQRNENYLFYPNEEIIRFFSKYIVKKKGNKLFDFIIESPRMLDLGCGVGRHVFYGIDNNVDSYGIDLSADAIVKAKLLAAEKGISNINKRFVVGDIRHMEWEKDYFNVVVSHGVLDSMPFDIARDGV